MIAKELVILKYEKVYLVSNLDPHGEDDIGGAEDDQPCGETLHMELGRYQPGETNQDSVQHQIQQGQDKDT